MSHRQDPLRRVEPEISAARLCAAICLVSASTVLFTLSVWKLLSFFIMPSLFFDLLFVGFPVGAVLGVRLFRVSLPSFRRTLAVLQVVMVLSVAASLACKHFDYLRAHLFEVQLVKLLGQMGTFTVLFLPFFGAYGLSEYVGYQLGTLRFHGRMRWVYGTYLVGAALAYLVVGPTLRTVGITGAIALALLGIAVASLALSGSRLGRAVLGLEAAALAALVLANGIEAGKPAAERRIGAEERFLDAYRGRGFQSTWDYRNERGYQTVFQEWGRYSLTEVLERPTRGGAGGGTSSGPSADPKYAGFYNDIMQWEFDPEVGFNERMLGAIPIHIAPRGGCLAIIGSGGGRQVQWATQPRYDFEKIVGLELEPAVIEAVRGPLRDRFARVYEHPTVEAVRAEARGYMESTTEAFDLIFLPSVGGYPQMMLEPGNMIRTFDAYRTLRDRLTDRGILAIWYPAGLDPRRVLTNQYVRTLGPQGLGMKTAAYFNSYEYLILAAKSPATELPTPARIEAFLTAEDDPSGLPARLDAGARPYQLTVPNDAGFQPITDDQPFLAGNVRHIFSLEQLYTLFVVVASFLLVVGAAILLAFRRSGDPRVPGRSYWQVSGLAVLIGANFILCEHFTVLALFRNLYVFQDALLLGAISFLVLSGLGSMLIGPRLRLPAQVLAALLLLPVLVRSSGLAPETILLLTAPVALVTGSFFPALFEACRKNPLSVFAMDAVGAAIGSACSFFLPIAFGFSTFFPVAAAVFVITAAASWRFGRGLGEDPDRPSAVG